MYQAFQHHDIKYPIPATGWVDGVYHPRIAQYLTGSSFLTKQDDIWKLHSHVWQETEETGYGSYYYEETTQFVTTLPGSNYKVTVIFANPTPMPYACHIRLNGVVKQDNIIVNSQQDYSITFTACMTDGSFRLSILAGAISDIHKDVVSGDVYIKDITISPEPAKKTREIPHVFLVSDSTVQSYEQRSYPQTGWGQVFYRFFQGAEKCSTYRLKQGNQGVGYELPSLVIENRAIAGRSARSFYDEGRLDQIMEELCPGDFMLVQFAHNDDNALRPNRYIAPDEFPPFLQRYLDACQRRGAQCIFVTPVTMMVTDENGKFQIAFNNYREKMLELAKARNTPLLDLGERSTAYLNEIGQEASKQIYLWAEEGEYPESAYAAGVSDRAHLQEYGAMVYANLVVKLIMEYQADHRLDVLKNLAAPREVNEIEKPRKTASPKVSQSASNAVTGFVVQEISLDDNLHGRGSFLLNWNQPEGAISYCVYARKKGESAFQKVKAITQAEKESHATLPFSAKAGVLWEYCVTAIFENGIEGQPSHLAEVDLR